MFIVENNEENNKDELNFGNEIKNFINYIDSLETTLPLVLGTIILVIKKRQRTLRIFWKQIVKKQKKIRRAIEDLK